MWSPGVVEWYGKFPKIYMLFSAPYLIIDSYSCDKFMKMNSGTKPALDEFLPIPRVVKLP